MNEQRRRQRRRQLTDKMLSELPRPLKPYFHPDPELPKHGVRIRPEGPGAYTVITRDPYKKQRWVKIGSVAEMKIAEAREVARAVIKRVEQGLDPFPAAPVKPDTVADVVEMYFKRHVEVRAFRTAGEKRRIVETHVLPVWRNRPFAAIGRSDIARLCDAVEDTHGAWVADTVLVELSAIARWYATRHDTYQPPFVAGMKRVSGEDRKRSRVLILLRRSSVISAASRPTTAFDEALATNLRDRGCIGTRIDRTLSFGAYSNEKPRPAWDWSGLGS
jgi:hypothetical protein